MAYSADLVDELFVKFEKCAQRQSANKGSAVKLRAAESDLLRVAEQVRDLLRKAVTGDRNLLVEVFGGNCRRFHRFRQVKEPIEFSEMHAKDPRWSDLSTSMETIEEILKQLGSFKPFTVEKKIAPEISAYKGLRERFTPGDRVWMRPECEGSEADAFSVSSSLPDCLVLNPSSGEISGTLKPGVEVPVRTYAIRASNAYGDTVIELTFLVSQPAPTSVTYADVPSGCFTNEVVHWVAEVEGGAPREWSVSPPLPPGLSLDQHGGAIAGVLMQTAEPTEYTVTAANACGSVSTLVSFGVKPAPPVSLTYADVREVFPFGSVIYLQPEVTLRTSAPAVPKRPLSAGWNKLRTTFLAPGLKWQQVLQATLARTPNVRFSVEPTLPDGLVLAAKTGVISGKPTAPSEAATYTVTCHNDGGECSVGLAFGIKMQSPSSLLYPQAREKYVLGQPVALSPEVQGLVSHWEVSPALPPGLDLDPCMGVVAGVPSEVVPEGSWRVTAKNAEGEASTTLTFAVQRAPPAGLDYPGLAEDYPLSRPLALHPTLEGQVDDFAVEPALPAGLELDAATGVVFGTPSEVTARATYTVTARNESGAVTSSLVFGVKVMPPESLVYPRVDDVYHVGESVALEAQIQGGATRWTVEPPLPEGLALDAATGKIMGAPASLADEASFVITASNEAGGTSAVITFAVTAPRPSGLRYADAGDDYPVGCAMSLEPQLVSGFSATFTVQPALPKGLELEPTTGTISGSPEEELPLTQYTVTAANPAGSCTAELTFSCAQPAETDATDDVTGVNQKFAAQIEEVTEISELCGEPGKDKNLGDWMIWMVHRAWLNDPSLVDFSFCNKWMPPPHMEPRIAPKLMKAMGHNTHIVSLQLANSNLMKPQGPQLAESLKKNTTLRILNIETNSLDSDALAKIAESLKENGHSALEQIRFNNQKSLGDFFGRPVEQAFAELAEQNTRIVKLGFTCNDAHWRLKINKAMLRNGDLARRRRKGSTEAEATEEEEIAAQDKPLARLVLGNPPEKAVWEVFDFEDDRVTLACSFMAENRKLPTKEQLQSFARSRGKPIPYSAVATVVKEFRAKLLNATVNSEVTVYDVYGADYPGCLRAWIEKNERWNLDVWKAGNTRYNFVSDRQPVMEASEAFSAWLHPPE